MPVILKVSPPLRSDELNALFASVRAAHSNVDVQPLLRQALCYVCAYQEAKLVGFAKIVSDGGVHGFLLDPTVTPNFQRQGIGRQLVERCAAESKQRGIEWLHVDFEPHLTEFYRRCGFSSTHAGLRNLKQEATQQPTSRGTE